MKRAGTPAVAIVATALLLGAVVAGVRPSRAVAGSACTGRAAVAGAATTRKPPAQCTDPCVAAARGDARACTSSVAGAFADALDGCVGRDHTCVDACRERRQECRDATTLGEDFAACDVQHDRYEDACRRSHPLGVRRVVCILRARVSHDRCRRSARRAHRRGILGCAKAFDDCAGACAPGTPPDGVPACRADARSTARGVLSSCKRTFQASMSACLNKDLQCGLDCTDTRQACTAPTQVTLDAALSACTAAQQPALQACVATYPSGSAALQACVASAQATAYACRDAALQAAIPGLEACVAPYLQCVHRCPPA